jgi:tetratricopeptide (TPR) repeat protein
MAALSLALLDGEIARKAGKLDDGVARFKLAAAIERSLPYTEPPYAYQPVSHLLGAALIEDRRAPEAEAIYRQSLETYRLDGWALMGLSQALAAQGKTAEAAQARRDFRAAWANADVKLASSRF